MNVIKKLNLSVVLLIALSSNVLGSNIAAAADSSVGTSTTLFLDVKNHWAKDTITWASNRHIVDGYPNGTFRPDLQVSEAEFLSMFVKGFGIAIEKDPVNWSQPVYTYVKSMNYPVKGFTDNKLRTNPINRLQVAEIIAGANGVNFTGNNAIQYILGKKYSNGKNGATIAGYAGSDNLTRAEAIQFIKNLLDLGMGELLVRPTEVSQNSLLPELPPAPMDTTKLPAAIASVYTKLQLIMKNYPGYNVITNEEHIGIAKDGNTFETVSFTPAKIKDQVSTTQLFSDQSDIEIKLAVELLNAQGFVFKDDLAKTIKNAMNSGEKIAVAVGDIEIMVAPYPDLKGNVDFWYVSK
jgi:hypothetical protein